MICSWHINCQVCFVVLCPLVLFACVDLLMCVCFGVRAPLRRGLLSAIVAKEALLFMGTRIPIVGSFIQIPWIIGV